MEEKKVTKISLSTFLFIISLIIIVIMGIFIFKLNNEKNIETQKSIDLQSQVDSLNGTVSNLQEKANTISETVNTTDYQISGTYYQKNAQGDEPNYTFSSNNKITYGALWTCSGTYTINNNTIKISFTSAVDPDGNKTNVKDLGVKETVELTIIDDNTLKDNSDEVIYSKKSEADLSQNTTNNVVVKEVEKQLNVDDVIALGYNQVAVLINGNAYVIPVQDRDSNYENYKLYSVKNLQGKVKAIRQFNLGTNPSEANYFIMEDGSVYGMSGYGNTSTAEKILDASKKITDIIEDNGIVYAVSQNGEKTKIAERYPGV